MAVEQLMDEVASVVVKNGGKVTARVSDGKQNSLRFMGKTRPRSVLKVQKKSLLQMDKCIILSQKPALGMLKKKL